MFIVHTIGATAAGMGGKLGVQDVFVQTSAADLLLSVEAQLTADTIVVSKLLDNSALSTFIVLGVQ